MTTAWTADHVRRINLAMTSRVPTLRKAERHGLPTDRIFWDMWPVQAPDGRVLPVGGRELWMALSAPERGDPNLRHFEAKIRLLDHIAGGWRDLGDALPDMAVSYEREWAGSAMSDGTNITLYFTAAGTSDRPKGYQQYLYEAHARLSADGLPIGWSNPVPSLVTLGGHYMPADAHEGEAGKIKALRDPAYFRDPADGAEYLIFTASLSGSKSPFNGAVGIARRRGDDWEALEPLIHADGVNNELERAHVVHHAGRYYAFWATQRGTFAPELRHAPNGLYGMVSDSLFGEYRPLNGSGLVLANPDGEPYQSYSWFVSADLEVSSFIDIYNLGGKPVPGDVAELSQHFGGVPAPILKLEIDGDHCRLDQRIAA